MKKLSRNFKIYIKINIQTETGWTKHNNIVVVTNAIKKFYAQLIHCQQYTDGFRADDIMHHLFCYDEIRSKEMFWFRSPLVLYIQTPIWVIVLYYTCITWLFWNNSKTSTCSVGWNSFKRFFIHLYVNAFEDGM